MLPREGTLKQCPGFCSGGMAYIIKNSLLTSQIAPLLTQIYINNCPTRCNTKQSNVYWVVHHCNS